LPSLRICTLYFKDAGKGIPLVHLQGIFASAGLCWLALNFHAFAKSRLLYAIDYIIGNTFKVNYKDDHKELSNFSELAVKLTFKGSVFLDLDKAPDRNSESMQIKHPLF
jgi:hypothetical protein